MSTSSVDLVFEGYSVAMEKEMRLAAAVTLSAMLRSLHSSTSYSLDQVRALTLSALDEFDRIAGDRR